MKKMMPIRYGTCMLSNLLLVLRYIGTIEYSSTTKKNLSEKILILPHLSWSPRRKGNLRGFNKEIIYKRLRETNKDICGTLGPVNNGYHSQAWKKPSERVAIWRETGAGTFGKGTKPTHSNPSKKEMEINTVLPVDQIHIEEPNRTYWWNTYWSTSRDTKQNGRVDSD